MRKCIAVLVVFAVFVAGAVSASARTRYGGFGNQSLSGGGGADTLLGFSGDDRLAGNGGDDFLDGGSGNDRLRGGAGVDLLDGGDGDDQIAGGPGDDFIIEAGLGHDTIFGGEGDDVIAAGRAADRIFAGSGDDIVYGGSGPDRIDCGAGNDVAYITTLSDRRRARGCERFRREPGVRKRNCRATTRQVFTDLAETIIGNGAANVCLARGGDDVLDLRAGADRGEGGDGIDTILGGAGPDVLLGGSGGDRLVGGRDADRVYGEGGDDDITGGAGPDRLSGGDGNDYISARGGGSDRVVCGRGRDTVIRDRSDRVAADCEIVARTGTTKGFTPAKPTPGVSAAPRGPLVFSTRVNADGTSDTGALSVVVTNENDRLGTVRYSVAGPFFIDASSSSCAESGTPIGRSRPPYGPDCTISIRARPPSATRVGGVFMGVPARGTLLVEVSGEVNAGYRIELVVAPT